LTGALLRRAAFRGYCQRPVDGRKSGGRSESRRATPPWRVGCGRSGG